MAFVMNIQQIHLYDLKSEQLYEFSCYESTALILMILKPATELV
jgi:hypothetical protein